MVYSVFNYMNHKDQMYFSIKDDGSNLISVHFINRSTEVVLLPLDVYSVACENHGWLESLTWEDCFKLDCLFKQQNVLKPEPKHVFFPSLLLPRVKAGCITNHCGKVFQHRAPLLQRFSLTPDHDSNPDPSRVGAPTPPPRLRGLYSLSLFKN